MSKKEKNLSLDNISYENGDGLSERIAKLIAAPGSLSTESQENTPTTTSSGKGKGVRPNNDFCNYCSEGGPLICCEKCPAAYHYHCCEPPLDPNNLPSEDWLCNSCMPAKPFPITNNSNKFLANAVFDIGLVPTPYELPDDLLPSSDLPGSTELQSRKRRNLNPIPSEQSKRKFNPSYPYDLQNFTATPVCFKCDKSHLGNKPLIFCSYCPLAFHLDCIYPPLPFRPNGMWMCPLHPQYSIPKFQSLRLSTRIQAHEASLEPVQEHAVRSKFLKKAKKCQNTLESVQRMTSIPGAVEQYYKIGLVFCRNNITLKSPRSLKELSATKVSENMLKVEKSEQQVSSLCSGSGCKHAAKQCKHYRKQSSSSSQSSSGGIASPWSAKTKRRSGCVVKTEQVEHVSRDSGGKNRDNGLKSKDIDKMLSGMSEGMLRELAAQFLQRGGFSNGEVLGKDLSPPTPPPLTHQFAVPRPPKSSHQVSDNRIPSSHVMAHSFLTQGDTKYSIRKNSFCIGIGHQADLKLDGSSCNALSVRHCCILFDKVTGMHELLNYSEYGTLVNSLLYGCSSSPHSTTRCACSPSVPLNGWEGPCQLSEGAQVQVGCQSFTFRTNPDFLWTPELVIPSDKLYHSPDKLDFMS